MNHASYIINTLPYSSDYLTQATMFALARVNLASRTDREESRERVSRLFRNQEIFQVLFEHEACLAGMEFAAPAESWAELGDMVYADAEYEAWCIEHLPFQILDEMDL
jgi:hypothetical protein